MFVKLPTGSKDSFNRKIAYIEEKEVKITQPAVILITNALVRY